MTHRNLTATEIEELQLKGCIAEDWNNILVHNKFKHDHFKNVRFSGHVKLGVFEESFTLPGGLEKHSGLRNVWIHNCEIGDNALIVNVENYVANYRIGNNVHIQNVHSLFVDGESSFGNGVEVAVLNETGGREVLIYDKLSAHVAYILSFYRHRVRQFLSNCILLILR